MTKRPVLSPRSLLTAVTALGLAAAVAPAAGGGGGAGGTGGGATTTTGTGSQAFCGDGQVGDDEECDDGNSDDADDCLNSCTLARCGDLVVHAGLEECDDGNLDDSDDCLTSCVHASCGDGFVWANTEQCDDGNGEDGDACSSTCTAGAGCGNGVTEAGEECDDGNASNSDACLAACVAATCGDGYAQLGVEECDDGNAVDDDNCTNACTVGQMASFGCPGTAIAVPADMEVTTTGDTSSAADDDEGSCGGFGAPEVVYEVTPQASGVLTIAVAGLTQASDPVLYVRSGSCQGGGELGCADQSFGGGTETLVLNVTAGTPYWVFADGYDGTAGSYALTLSLSTSVAGDDCPGNPVTIALNESKT